MKEKFYILVSLMALVANFLNKELHIFVLDWANHVADPEENVIRWHMKEGGAWALCSQLSPQGGSVVGLLGFL